MSKYYLGIMCGTSLDSIDISIVSCSASKFKVFGFKEYRLHDSYKQRINNLKQLNTNQELTKLNSDITNLVSNNIHDILKTYKLTTNDISAIGLSGITLNHRPDLKISTYLGNPKLLGSTVDIPVVADFRQTDIDAGGQGAPLTGYFHEYLTLLTGKSMIYINLGGFANISLNHKSELISYDSGPANYLIDLWCREKFDVEFDLDGQLASMGNINTDLLVKMLQEKYFKKKSPKSTGFELFNRDWIKSKLSEVGYVKEIDVLSTLTYLTVVSISNEINIYKKSLDKIFFYGGGSFNKLITNGILDLTNLKKISKLRFSINEKNLESTAFAWLAYMRVNKKMFAKSKITGAKKSRYLGNIY